jgi:hypothetical protein
MNELKIIEGVHPSLPSGKTIENLAQWITSNQKEVINHSTKIPLTPEEISQLEHDSSVASRGIDELDEVKESFMHFYKKGTAWDGDKFLPSVVTIPGSKGVDVLKANRAFADALIKKGYNEDITVIYLLPYPEESMMVALTIEGHEVPKYSRKMTKEEDKNYGKLFKKEGDDLFPIENADIDVSRNGTVNIKTKKTREPLI